MNQVILSLEHWKTYLESRENHWNLDNKYKICKPLEHFIFNSLKIEKQALI